IRWLPFPDKLRFAQACRTYGELVNECLRFAELRFSSVRIFVLGSGTIRVRATLGDDDGVVFFPRVEERTENATKKRNK
ncbi:hypothetical protein PFISCL1PPCAC_17606, partial [Pristionchus fissidentatus]